MAQDRRSRLCRGSAMSSVVVGGLALGAGAFAARAGLRALHRSGVKVQMPAMPAMNMPSFGGIRNKGLTGFESPMTRNEAREILNINAMNPSKDAIREAHRRLLVANHPDKGGSTFVASKINEAKDSLLGKRTGI
uniref:J domain-containing protein n=1 Tax=Noctiluca scintillans TaxID=2966 RepID=A0A7S1EVK9_NOCSC